MLYQTVFGPPPFILSGRPSIGVSDSPAGMGFHSPLLLWTSQVKSYECIRACIPNIAASQAIQTALYNADENRLSFADRFIQFLKDSRGRFGKKFDFLQADSPAFQPRMFLWAATGAPFINPNDGEIEIAILESTHPMYAENAGQGQLMALQGRISF
ncbi:hypothetical protein K443DRAFT_8131 [Laccaria amethystina LaAM-08-1]|uniref:Uncharacterized protein n=1 Tax=Laccaria amethystina LaAM-08-1 TaxID=1095629 RepID=A0A0C9XDV9_9AGAR|nr:hypothetical protein K443DRAFT_8131 [Laccaria amethystina LaAM-08-1]